jgi:hypothetical protein
MKHIIGLTIVALSLSLAAYFLYSFIWFVFVGHRAEKPITTAVTSFGYLAVISSGALWLLGAKLFADGPRWYAHERLLLWTCVALCVAAIAAARFSARRTPLPIAAAAGIVALNWIGSVLWQ